MSLEPIEGKRFGSEAELTVLTRAGLLYRGQQGGVGVLPGRGRVLLWGANVFLMLRMAV